MNQESQQRSRVSTSKCGWPQQAAGNILKNGDWPQMLRQAEKDEVVNPTQDANDQPSDGAGARQ